MHSVWLPGGCRHAPPILLLFSAGGGKKLLVQRCFIACFGCHQKTTSCSWVLCCNSKISNITSVGLVSHVVSSQAHIDAVMALGVNLWSRPDVGNLLCSVCCYTTAAISPIKGGQWPEMMGTLVQQHLEGQRISTLDLKNPLAAMLAYVTITVCSLTMVSAKLQRCMI